MKIKIKKIIASVLTFMMVFTQVPVNVFAADTNISNDGNTYRTSTPGTYNLPGGTYYTKKYSTWADAGTKVYIQYDSSKKGTIALNILGDVVNNPEKSGRFDFIRADSNTDVTINMNGHTFTYSGNDVYSLCGFVGNSGTMTIEEQVSKGIMAAMKAKDTIRLEVLRNIKKVFIEAKSVAGAPEQIADSESVKIIQKLAKQGRESAEIYKNQGREDLYAHEMAQVEVLNEFLPKQLSEEELRTALKVIIEKVGATSAKEMGKVMGVASKELAGVADGKAISAMVKELLS